MPAPNASTFDLVPPTRPGTETFNGIAKEDDSDEPPDPQTMPNAAEWNTIEWLIVAIGRVMPVAVISVTGSTATVTGFGTAPEAPILSTFTMAHPSTGVVEITWPTNTFPTPTMKPTAGLNSGPGQIWAESMTNGVRVHTYGPTGTAADLDFTVTVN